MSTAVSTQCPSTSHWSSLLSCHSWTMVTLHWLIFWSVYSTISSSSSRLQSTCHSVNSSQSQLITVNSSQARHTTQSTHHRVQNKVTKNVQMYRPLCIKSVDLSRRYRQAYRLIVRTIQADFKEVCHVTIAYPTSAAQRPEPSYT